MPRKARATLDGVCYHVFNRTVDGQAVLGEPSDCWRFIELINAAQNRTPMDLFAACLMPDRFHFVVRPRLGKDLGSWMQWVLTTQVRRWHAQHRSHGQLWKGRFKAFRIAQDKRLLEVMRYVESNPVRAGLVAQAEHWAWGSLNWRNQVPAPVVLAPPPVPLPPDWTQLVNKPQSTEDLADLRECIDKQRQYGKTGALKSTSE